MTKNTRSFCLLAGSTAIGVIMAFVAQLLIKLINLVTALAFYHRWSTAPFSPAAHSLGAWVIVVPIVGAVIVGYMARYGSMAIRGHGIPEAMEQVLLNDSRIPPRVFLLKPLSAAVSIGSGGPFGAEGPIIATGGALGSLIGQIVPATGFERKTLLAAGAAAGMAATFGCPISAVILAVELLLFEFHPRSIVPVAAASVAAAAVRQRLLGSDAVFPSAVLAAPHGGAVLAYALIGAVMGVLAVLVTKIVYGLEDAFEHLPVHLMWWPALGAVAVGVVGWIEPRTLGVGYENITQLLEGAMGGPGRLSLLKFASWSVSLSSGTSGGTLAPLLTIGAGAGTVLGHLLASLPGSAVDPRMSAVVGMAALFAGASGALLASVVFALETTLQPAAIVPLLAGCAASFYVSRRLMQTTIMTEKISRRGVRVPEGYLADPLERGTVGEAASTAICLEAARPAREARHWALSGEPGSRHSAYPVVDAQGRLVGIVERRDLLLEGQAPTVAELAKPAHTLSAGSSLREAVELMLARACARIVVLEEGGAVAGILARADVVDALHESPKPESAEKAVFRGL